MFNTWIVYVFKLAIYTRANVKLLEDNLTGFQLNLLWDKGWWMHLSWSCTTFSDCTLVIKHDGMLEHPWTCPISFDDFPKKNYHEIRWDFELPRKFEKLRYFRLFQDHFNWFPQMVVPRKRSNFPPIGGSRLQLPQVVAASMAALWGGELSSSGEIHRW